MIGLGCTEAHDANCNVFAGRAALLLSNLSGESEGEHGATRRLERERHRDEREEDFQLDELPSSASTLTVLLVATKTESKSILLWVKMTETMHITPLDVMSKSSLNMQINPHTHIFCRSVAGVRVLIRLKNGDCISLADLSLGAKSLKLQLVSHNPLPSQQLCESLGPWQEVMRGEERGLKKRESGESLKS